MPFRHLSLPVAENDTYPDGHLPEQSITDIIPNGFFSVDEQWTVKFWNASAEKLLHRKAADIIGKNLWKELEGVLPPGFYELYHQAFLRDIPVHFEEYWPEIGGWFDVISYHTGNTLSVSFKSRTDRSDLQQQLKLMHKLYRFVTTITNDCLWEWNIASRQLFWIDGGHKRMFGYPIENALIPQDFWESCVHPGDRDRVLNGLKAQLDRGKDVLWEEEYRLLKADGEYAHVHDRGRIIYGDDGIPIRMIGATHDITERVYMENVLMQERKNRQKEITSAVLTAQENERADIGKEMHDNLNQILGAAKLYIELAKTDDENRPMCLERSSAYILDVIQEIRKISKNLITPAMVMGLSESIHIIVDDILLAHSMTIDFEYAVSEDLINEKTQLNVFRIVQEQMNNILKHASATHVSISLTQTENDIILLIYDNGKGCDLKKERKGVGIINIKSRVELFDGMLDIKSAPGEGYFLNVIIPLNTHKT